MVVDDTPHVLRMLTSMLEIDGFEVVSQASSGAEAIERLDDADPDVVVIDYKMPAMDGLTAARELRSRRPDQVVVLYTAYIDAALEREAAEAGGALRLYKNTGLASV